MPVVISLASKWPEYHEHLFEKWFELDSRARKPYRKDNFAMSKRNQEYVSVSKADKERELA